jgi:hypothetical protein
MVFMTIEADERVDVAPAFLPSQIQHGTLESSRNFVGHQHSLMACLRTMSLNHAQVVCLPTSPLVAAAFELQWEISRCDNKC